MDDENVSGAGGAPAELESRPPTEEDLVSLCRRLNELGANYVVVGGFAIMQAGLPRATGDIDLLVATDLENEKRVYEALEILPDRAVRELEAGDIANHVVVRVADEVVVDLMRSAGAIEYAEAAQDLVVRRVRGRADIFCITALTFGG